MAPICGQRYLCTAVRVKPKVYMACVYLYDTNNMAGATTRTVIVEIKYFCTKNVVMHTENCKLNFEYFSPSELLNNPAVNSICSESLITV